MKDYRGNPKGGARINEEALAVTNAQRALNERRPLEAIRVLEPWVDRPSAAASTLLCAARAQLALGMRRRALVLLDRAIPAGAEPVAHLLRGMCLSYAGRTDEACEAFRVSLKDAALRIDGSCAMAIALENASRIEEARALLEPLVGEVGSSGHFNHMLATAWARVLTQLKRFDEADAQIAAALAHLGSTHAPVRNELWYLRAKIYDRCGRYDEAFAAAVQANMIGEMPFDPAEHTRHVSDLIARWSRDAMSHFPKSGCSSEIPVFVSGMPRSGTTLIDQIVDAHPQGAGVGELAHLENFARRIQASLVPGVAPPACFGNLQDQQWADVANAYLTEITTREPTAQRIVNKALGNTQILWLIAALFPKTRIVHVTRDPRDVAVSCLMGGFNNRLHPWTTRVEWVAHAWRESQRLMAHWRATLAVPILDVSYENLVEHSTTEFPRIIEFFGLPWDEACYRFHESKRTVRTLSYDQVNRPLYSSSIARHKNYAKSISVVDWPAYDPSAPAGV